MHAIENSGSGDRTSLIARRYYLRMAMGLLHTLMRVNLDNVLGWRTLDRGKATIEILGARWHTTYPGSRPHSGGSLRPASNPVYDHNGVYRESP
jgi:hypothetical protein